MEKLSYPVEFYRDFFRKGMEALLPERTVEEELVERLARSATARSYRKKEFVIRRTEPQQDFYFVLSGAFRSFMIKDDGGEVSNNFMYRPGEPFIVSLSFEDGERSIDSVQATSINARLILLPLSVLRALQEEFPWVNFLIIKMLSQSFQEYHTIMNVRTWSVARKYRWLHEEHPDLEEKIQAQYLAQYLDMEKTVFSRVKNEYAAAHPGQF